MEEGGNHSHFSCIFLFQFCHICSIVCYILGGFGALSESWLKDKSPENCLSSVEIYDPETNSWSAGPELPVPLCAMGVVKYYGTVYVLGMVWSFDAFVNSAMTTSRDVPYFDTGLRWPDVWFRIGLFVCDQISHVDSSVQNGLLLH